MSLLAADQLDERLQESGIRAIVTSRAKHPRNLEAKVRQRSADKDYKTFDDIYNDIVDLAGVRVALYFPAERNEVGKIITDQFVLTGAPKVFDSSTNPNPDKRFSGYCATHYRGTLKKDNLLESNHRYAESRIEIQVASVLMHAWAEVEHDMSYKPLQGKLSKDETAILDQLNGMVQAGEIALEMLQRAGELRVQSIGAKFENHFDLASYLLKNSKPLVKREDSEPILGNVQLLFRLLTQLNIQDLSELTPYIDKLDPDTEQRPVAQQIIDQIVATDPERYKIYGSLRSDLADESSKSYKLWHTMIEYVRGTGQNDGDHEASLGYFLRQWIKFERFARQLISIQTPQADARGFNSLNALRSMNLFSTGELDELSQIRKVRNYLVHGVEVPNSAFINELGRWLDRWLQQLHDHENENVRRAAQNLDEGFN